MIGAASKLPGMMVSVSDPLNRTSWLIRLSERSALGQISGGALSAGGGYPLKRLVVAATLQVSVQRVR
jgi:hypothetical protein